MRYLSLAFLSLFCVAAVGCGGDEISDAFSKMTKENVQKATMMYTIYSTMNNYRGPESLEQMTEFLKTDAQALKRLERVKIDVNKLDDYLKGRDGEVFEFRWSVQSNPMAAPYPVCWERTGFEGTIQVGVSGGRVVETGDEDELAELKAGKYNDGGSYGDAQEER